MKELETSGNTKKEPARTTAQTTFSEVELMADENESQKDTPDVPMRFNEKKRLNWRGLTCKLLFVWGFLVF